MAQARYWKMAAVGGFTTGPFVGEIATVGISGVGVDGGGDFSPGISIPLPTFDASPTGDVGENATFSWQLGSVGSGVWSEQNQVALATKMRTFLAAQAGNQINQFRWTEIRLSAYDNADDVINGASVFTLKSPVVGGGSPSGASPATAIVASLRTGGRGPANRGRIYLPYHAPSLANLILTTVTQDYVGNAAADLIADTQISPGKLGSCVVSTTRRWYSTISEVRVGDELDFQQRRRRKRKETYRSYVV